MERSRSNTKNGGLDRPTTAPPAPLLAMSPATSTTDPAAKIDLSDLDTTNMSLDTEGLFATNTDWSLLGKAIAVLQDQYEQCLQDIAALEVMKQEALNDPELFVQRLRRDKPGDLNFPSLQTIYRCPEVDVDRFAVRSTRRGLNKKEQNAEFILGRLKELQQRGSVVLPVPVRSDSLVIDTSLSVNPNNTNNTNTTTNTTNNNNNKTHRERYLAILEDPTISRSSTPSTTPSATSTTLQSSSAPTSPLQKRQKTDTYNIPWTREEKMRLNDLLLQYPEEPVAARRYAKIAAALGTRSATQVFTRVTKLMASKRAHLADVSDSEPVDPSPSAPNTTANATQKPATDTAEYKEYIKLKRALEQELINAGTAPIHSGIACAACHARPIIGIRYRCLDCLHDLCDVCFVPGKSENVHHLHRVQTVPLQPIVDSTMAEFDYLNP